ncbi:hypothetical protein I3842_16G083600 [Carya illinoinensis]|uniref:Transmembrane protein n=1 Tax=Carya illinoinensis TaxID=32201 RepID=A0A922A5V7_CARIL|nr:hypothetical protein I3842_16G083600 [Carya illinoinensis]
MVRELISNQGGSTVGDFCNAFLLFWAVLVSLSLISVIIFSCAGGVSKEKNSTTDTEYYGAGCEAGCGAACGG